MTADVRQALSHVLWIGGATDSGKSTAAQKLAERHNLQIYHYDKHDPAHHERLAKVHPAYAAFLAASLDERWVSPQPEELFQRAVQAFRDRFPLMIQDLMAMPGDRGIVAEGFGLLPELLAPILTYPDQAIWLAPTDAFKRASMLRRGKPSFATQTSDPERAKANLYGRDCLLAEYFREQAWKYGYTLYEVDETLPADEMVGLIERHFVRFLQVDG